MSYANAPWPRCWARLLGESNAMNPALIAPGSPGRRRPTPPPAGHTGRGEKMTLECRQGRAPEPVGEADRATERTECRPETATEGRSVQSERRNHQGSVNSVRSGNSVLSVNSVYSVHSVHSVVQDTLPAQAEGWKAGLFRLTRALKFDCGLDGRDMAQVRPHVEEWYREARAVIGEVPFSDVWGEVVTSWERAKHAAFQDPLAEAVAKAREEGNLPAVPASAGYDEAEVALAYRTLFWLALDSGLFFVSCRALGERLGMEHTKAWRILRMFEADGIILCLKRGKRPKATRYRWNGVGAGL
jgi:hypothetical protein